MPSSPHNPDRDLIGLSKLLSLVLRHNPARIGIALDAAGWVAVDLLLAALARHGSPISRATLEELVQTSDKKRFAFSDDGARIRANQGHSVDVELGYTPCTPPALLYHGTATRFLDSIRRTGLVRGNRHHVHLSADRETATKVGQRHGKVVVLTVRAGQLHADGAAFYQSANGVWLVDAVPPAYLDMPPPVG